MAVEAKRPGREPRAPRARIGSPFTMSAVYSSSGTLLMFEVRVRVIAEIGAGVEPQVEDLTQAIGAELGLTGPR